MPEAKENPQARVVEIALRGRSVAMPGQRHPGRPACCLTKVCYPTGCCRLAFFLLFFSGLPGAKRPDWSNASDDERCIAWARAFFEAAAPFALGSAYVNFLTQEKTGHISAVYGPNYAPVREKYEQRGCGARQPR